ncbi:MAG: hypothetical protein QOJ19_1873, partial [Acidimicrobiia bacterium]|nr:hypothetical protein [Acidimicrobiia bacterium]
MAPTDAADGHTAEDLRPRPSAQHRAEADDHMGGGPATLLDERPSRPGRHAAVPSGGLVLPRDVPAIEEQVGQVVTRSADGPRFRRGRAKMAVARQETFVHLLTTPERAAVALLSLGWLTALLLFWQWWLLEPGRITTVTGMALNTVLLLYVGWLPGYFVLAANRLRGIRPDIPVPALRAAFVVTKAPSEPWPVARRTLQAMQAQDYPHPYDVWLCDENPSEGTLAWCEEHGIRVATRHGVEEYHRQEWPRRTRCKEGNLA